VIEPDGRVPIFEEGAGREVCPTNKNGLALPKQAKPLLLPRHTGRIGF
jgi:hypothetical protein